MQSMTLGNLESSVYGSPAVARRKSTAANRSLYRRDPASAEALLIERLKAGDSKVLETIFNTYSKKLYNVALRILGEAADTHEVIQDVFWTAFRKAQSFRGNSRFSSWLYRLTPRLAAELTVGRSDVHSSQYDPHTTSSSGQLQDTEEGGDMIAFSHRRATVNGVSLHYVVVGKGPVVLCMHGWPQNYREFLPVIKGFPDQYTFIAPDLRGFADSDKPYDGYEPKTIAKDMLALLATEGVEKFHILSHDLGGPPSVALAYMASDRALSLATIETPFFGLDFPGYVDPRVTYWHLGMHMNMDITRFLVEGREEQYLRHFFRDFAYNPAAIPEEELQQYVMQMRQPGNLRASLNHYGYIPQMAAQTSELAKSKLTVPMLAWGGRVSFGDHCFNSAKTIAVSAKGGVIEECGHWVFEEKTEFIRAELDKFWKAVV